MILRAYVTPRSASSTAGDGASTETPGPLELTAREPSEASLFDLG